MYGKCKGYPPNRILCDEDGNPYDVIVGTFYICGLTQDNFGSLPDELAEKYTERFRCPEMFWRTEDNGVFMCCIGSVEPSVRLF